MIPEVVMQYLQAIALVVSIIIGLLTLKKGGISLGVLRKP